MKVPKYIIEKMKRNQKLQMKSEDLLHDIDNWLEKNVTTVDLSCDSVVNMASSTDSYDYKPLVKAIENDEDIID